MFKQLLFLSLTTLLFFVSFNVESGHKLSDDNETIEIIEDIKAIRSVINTTYDTPDHKVKIEPVVVKGNHAVASWTQSEKGGRVVMFRNAQQKWEVVLCSGKAVKDASFLTETGIPSPTAQELAKILAEEEAKLDQHKVALFDSFNAIIRGSHQPKSDEHKKTHELSH